MKPLLSLLAASLIAVALPAARAATATPDLSAQLDRYLAAVAHTEHFMGSVLVARDGEVLLAKGYGFADVQTRASNTPATQFRIGSVTKQFTAMAILILQREGKLNVQDRVCKYVPQCPADWQPITIAELLTHTSGIPDYLDGPDTLKTIATRRSVEQLIALFRNRPLEFKPGSKWSYSNSGYVLLGDIIQRVSGETYARFLQQHIFGPLGMRDSGYDRDHPVGGRHALGYQPGANGKYEPALRVVPSEAFSAGGIHSTVGDLYRWDQALGTGKLIPAALSREMFAPHALVTGELAKLIGTPGDVHYGYGWFISHRFGHLEYSHEGGMPGFTSLNAWYPDQHVAVIVLDNNGTGNIFAIGHALAAIVFGQPYTTPQPFKAITLPPQALQKFVGAYELHSTMGTGTFMHVTRDGDQLHARLSGQPAVAIYPESPTRFFYKVVRASIDFQVDTSGKVTGVALHQDGMTLSGKPAVQPKTVAVSPAQLQKLVGVYRMSPTFAITVTRKDGQLQAQGTGQPTFPIYPKSATEFYAKVVPAQFDFVMGANGEATAMVLHQNGHEVTLKKVAASPPAGSAN